MFRRSRRKLITVIMVILAGVGLTTAAVSALIPPPGPSDGSIGLEGTVPSAAPTQGATITVPADGSVFTGIPITASGICPSGLLVKLFANDVFVGSVVCTAGSYSLQVSLFSGRNDLVARVYDALDQAGPDSNTVHVTFNDAQFDAFGTHVVLSSEYARRGAPPGTELEWPIILSDGVGPYALSVDWGDGTSTDLLSVENPGTLTIRHTYKSAGIYRIVIKATDKNGGTAFLQLVGQATGAIQTSTAKKTNNTIVTRTSYWPALTMFPLLLVTFWLGRNHMLHSLKQHH